MEKHKIVVVFSRADKEGGPSRMPMSRRRSERE